VAAANHVQIPPRLPEFEIHGDPNWQRNQELLWAEWKAVQERLAEQEQQQRKSSPELPMMEKVVLNLFATAPYEASLFLLEMSGPGAAAEIEKMRQQLRPIKYTTEEEAAGAAMEGAFRQMALTLGPAAAESVARGAMLALVRQGTPEAGQITELAVAEQAVLNPGQTVTVEGAEVSGPRFAGVLDRLPPRLNPFNYECTGLGCNFGNIQFRPSQAASPSELAPEVEARIVLHREVSTEELEMAQRLAGEGDSVEALQESADKTADFLVDGVKTELKTVKNVTTPDVSKALSSTILRAGKQGEHVILDVRMQPGATQDVAEQAVRRAYGNQARRGKDAIKQVRVIGSDFDIVIPYQQ
jgi:hypothetical protein